MVDGTNAGCKQVETRCRRWLPAIFAALAEFERELIRERTMAGLSSARARGRNGGRPYTMTLAKLRLAQVAMAKRDTKVGDLCRELGVTRQTIYRFVDPNGELRADGTKLLKCNGQSVSLLTSKEPTIESRVLCATPIEGTVDMPASCAFPICNEAKWRLVTRLLGLGRFLVFFGEAAKNLASKSR